MAEAQLREVVTGRFGTLTVSDEDGVRALCCDSACHGASWLEPAVPIDGVLVQPGPIPESIYQLGWLLAAAARPTGHVLMAGLGPGAGPVALAWAYPKLRITVVEVDPVIVALARRQYPLLAHFERTGQIRIVIQDIVEHVWQATDGDWSLACLDAYANVNSIYCPSELLQGLHGRAEAVWVNVLEEHERLLTRRQAQVLEDAGWPPAVIMPIRDPIEGTLWGNVLIGTQPLDREALLGFAPFATLDHANAARAQAQLDTLIGLTHPYLAIVDPDD